MQREVAAGYKAFAERRGSFRARAEAQ